MIASPLALADNVPNILESLTGSLSVNNAGAEFPKNPPSHTVPVVLVDLAVMLDSASTVHLALVILASAIIPPIIPPTWAFFVP